MPALGGLVDEGTFSNITSGAMNVAVLIVVLIIIGGLLAFILWTVMKYKRYTQFSCVVWEKDGFGQVTQHRDSAGIFVDPKTRNKRFYMRKANVGLTPDNIPYIPSGRTKLVYLYKTGLKNYHFIRPSITDNKIKLEVGEEDVNWAINAYERQKKTFASTTLMQFMPYIAIAFVTIVILVIFIYFFKDFAVLREVAVQLKEAAIAVAQAKSGTVVV